MSRKQTAYLAGRRNAPATPRGKANLRNLRYKLRYKQTGHTVEVYPPREDWEAEFQIMGRIRKVKGGYAYVTRGSTGKYWWGDVFSTIEEVKQDLEDL